MRARVYVCTRACESAQARSPKWNSMTELEREKGNNCGKGEGNEMEVWRRKRREAGGVEREANAAQGMRGTRGPRRCLLNY